MSEVLTIDEVASLLKMSKRQVYELTRARTRALSKLPIPLVRINSNTRFLRTAIENWLQQLSQEAA